ncbi:MAG TPA: ATP-binding protein, partial [Candidatus Acidoferrum sp.]
MEPATTNAMKQIRHGGRSLFRRSRLSIGTRLSVCFVAIVVSMIAADVVVVWQLERMAAPTQRLSAADQVSLAIVRVYLDVDAFQHRATELARSHDARQFANEVASLRHTFLQDVEHTEQALGEWPAIEQDPAISSALETLKVALPSQLDTMLVFATAGDWNALGLRLAERSQDPIQLSSLLVERLNQQVLQQRAKAVENIRQARRQLFIAIPIAALLTLFAAAALGWYTTRTITVPLSGLAAGAQALARGDFQHQVEVGGNDELTVLGKAFNYAARRLSELYEGLRRSEKQLRDVINTVPAYMWSASHDGVVDFVNQGWQEFTGLPPEGGLGRNWESLLHPDDRAKFVAEWGAALRNGQSMEGEARVLRADGEYRWWFCRNVPLRDETGNIVKWYGTGVDIEDRKRAEEARDRLRQLEADLKHINRVSTMGELTASLAHEINQPIGAAVTNAQACLRFLNRGQPDVPEAREAAVEMVGDVRRAVDIIERVRSLYRKGSPHQEMVDVNEVIREMVVMLHKEANRYSVDMHAELCAHLPNVVADRVQLQQVLMNLMTNGIEAMRDGGGELSIKSGLAEDGQLLIAVIDSGVGLPAGRADEIFDAFFTTKLQGTGLGLAITRSIVESHGGRVWATANSGRGATFQFTLPQKT